MLVVVDVNVKVTGSLLLRLQLQYTIHRKDSNTLV